jgi:hypothetical protein
MQETQINAQQAAEQQLLVKVILQMLQWARARTSLC